MMEKIMENQTTIDNYWNELHQVIAQTTATSTNWNGDEMPRRIYGTFQGNKSIGMDDTYAKKKVLHPQGIHAGVKLVPVEGSEYTGLYQGHDYGILRLSDAEFMLDAEYANH